jgi:twinkle protein
MDVNELKSYLSSRAEWFAEYLFPQGKQDGSEWIVGSLGGEAGQSCKIKVTGDKAGIWKDFSSGEGGDNLLELYIQKNNVSFIEAFNEVHKLLNITVDSSRSTSGIKSFAKAKPKKEYKKPETSGLIGLKPDNPIFDYLTKERLILPEIIAEYKVASTSDSSDIVFPYIDSNQELHWLKFLGLNRKEGKKRVRTSAAPRKSLYGEHLCKDSDRELVITEGEIDCMTIRQVTGILANSVPFGAKHTSDRGEDPNDEWITNSWEYLQRFEVIYLCLDEDTEGHAARESLIKRLGIERCKIVNLPCKDANKCLQENQQEELKEAFKKADYIMPEKLKNLRECRESLAEEFFSPSEAIKGIPFPFRNKNNEDARIRLNEFSIWTGFSGSGKSQMLNFLTVFLRTMDKSTTIASLEVTPTKTASFMVQQALGLECPTDRSHLDKAVDWLAAGIWFYDHVGKANLSDILEAFLFSYRRYGTRYFIVDSFMKLGINGDDFNAQKAAIGLINQFVKDYDCHIFVVAHSRKKEDENATPNKMDVRGIADITDEAHLVCSVWRNKMKQSHIRKLLNSGREIDVAKAESMKNSVFDTKLTIHKQRNGTGDEPEYELFFDKKCRQFSDTHIQNSRDYTQNIANTDETRENEYDEEPF